MGKLVQALGRLVEVNGHKMHVYTQGTGENTFVFMSGGGTCCPTLDFKPLWSILSHKNKIVVVEKAGYGWSEATDDSRALDIMLAETRAALGRSNISPPYILIPHSMSGLEAIFWAQNYPNEIKAIIGLDPAVPEAYDVLKLPSALSRKTISILRNLRVHNIFINAICKRFPAIQSGYLTESEIKTYKAIISKSFYTTNMINEVFAVKDNSNMVKKNLIPSQIPMYFFISNGKGTGIQYWDKILIDYLSNFQNAKYLPLNCGHYVHAYEPVIIADEIDKFICRIDTP